MHVALIADGPRLHQEGGMIGRVVRNLTADGLGVTAVVPLGNPDDERPPIADDIEMVATPMQVLPWMRRSRRDNLVEAFGKTPPDIVYAIGAEAWAVGLDLTRATETPLVVDVWCAHQTRSAPRGARADSVAAYVAPTEPIADTLRRRVDSALVTCVPFGVEIPERARPVFDDADRAVSLVILGGARDVPAYQGLLGGLSRIVKQVPQLQVFIDLSGPHEHEIWREARKLDLLGNLSTLVDAVQHRALLTCCDALLLPERYGEVRSIMLDAMAAGLPVIAGNDPYLDLEEGVTIVERIDAEGWAGGLDRVLRDKSDARELGEAGRAWVTDRHRHDQQARGLAETFERILTGGAHKFPAGKA